MIEPDGANAEILEEVGEDNIFIFGQTVEGIEKLRTNGYEPRKHYETDEELKAVLDWLSSDYFSPKEGNVLEDLPKSLLDWGDPFFVLADYRAYVEAQEKVNSAYLDQGRWASMAIRNAMGSGKPSDRTIGEYASDIWKLDPLKAASSFVMRRNAGILALCSSRLSPAVESARNSLSRVRP